MSSAAGESGQPADGAPGVAPPEPTASLLVGGGDHCTNCGAALAVDQRYCVECGTRRGKPRFMIAGATPQQTPAQTAPASTVPAGWTRLSAILAVIAVLLAIGVGVLIGNASQSAVKVQLNGAALSSSGSGSSNKTTSKSGSGSSSSSTCTKGTAGCKNGKQTGNFFGG